MPTIEQKFAARTKVSAEDSISEMRRLLKRHGADQFYYGANEATGAQLLGFRIANRMVRIQVGTPANFKGDRTKEDNRRWRVVLLVMKAKLVAIEEGVTTIEREFLADIILANNQTVGEWAAPQIEQAYLTGKMPPLLPGVE